jgi:hypothetical protein
MARRKHWFLNSLFRWLFCRSKHEEIDSLLSNVNEFISLVFLKSHKNDWQSNRKILTEQRYFEFICRSFDTTLQENCWTKSFITSTQIKMLNVYRVVNWSLTASSKRFGFFNVWNFDKYSHKIFEGIRRDYTIGRQWQMA